MNEFWDLFVQDFHATQWPVWFMAAGMLGFGLGWKACCLLKFGHIKMRMHEVRILQQIEKAEQAGAFGSAEQRKNPKTAEDKLNAMAYDTLRQPVGGGD